MKERDEALTRSNAELAAQVAQLQQQLHQLGFGTPSPLSQTQTPLRTPARTPARSLSPTAREASPAADSAQSAASSASSATVIESGAGSRTAPRMSDPLHQAVLEVGRLFFMCMTRCHCRIARV